MAQPLYKATLGYFIYGAVKDFVYRCFIFTVIKFYCISNT